MTQQKRVLTEIVDVVKEAGNSGRIYLPKAWVGKTVVVRLMK